MKLIFFLSILTIIFTFGKAKQCYSCIVDSEDNNRTSLSNSIDVVVGDTMPTEYCNISTDLSEYRTCSTKGFCVKGVVENTYGETLLYFCQGNTGLPHLELDEPKRILHTHFQMTLYSCNENLCNGTSALFPFSAPILYLLLITLFFIRKF